MAFVGRRAPSSFQRCKAYGLTAADEHEALGGDGAGLGGGSVPAGAVGVVDGDEFDAADRGEGVEGEVGGGVGAGIKRKIKMEGGADSSGGRTGRRQARGGGEAVRGERDADDAIRQRVGQRKMQVLRGVVGSAVIF